MESATHTHTQVQDFARVHLLFWLGVFGWATGPLLPFLLLFPHSAGDTTVTVPSSHRQLCLSGNSCSHHHGPGHSREGHIGGAATTVLCLLWRFGPHLTHGCAQGSLLVVHRGPYKKLKVELVLVTCNALPKFSLWSLCGHSGVQHCPGVTSGCLTVRCPLCQAQAAAPKATHCRLGVLC